MLFKSIIPVALTGLAVTVDAYWRMPCGLIQTGRVDAVINPGMISPHVHGLVGAASKFPLIITLTLFYVLRNPVRIT